MFSVSLRTNCATAMEQPAPTAAGIFWIHESARAVPLPQMQQHSLLLGLFLVSALFPLLRSGISAVTSDYLLPFYLHIISRQID